MKNLIEKDRKRKEIFIYFEKKRIILKYIYSNLNYPLKVRQKAYNKLIKLPKNSSNTRLRNRCILTGRSRATYRKFKFSRLMLRNLASRGDITGVKKSSW